MSNRFPTRLNVDDFSTVNRRQVLRGLGTSALITAAGGLFARSIWGSPVFAASPFALGVASGDPEPDGFVIWTKIAPRPLERGGGMPRKPVEVEWSVATDERLRQVVQKGTATAHPELGHAVHVEVGGLEPGRDYFYQFTIGGERSRLGRARTPPPAGASVAQLRFGMAGCQRYDDGYFTAYRQIAAERFDFVFHYGDYIYEYRVVRPGERPRPVVRVMPNEPDEIYTLDDYRQRYAIYKTDPDLQSAHASTAFLMSYDDHEVDNNWAGDISEENTRPELFLLRRAAAFQAWYEHMPVRRALMPRGPDILAYRRFVIGDLVSMNVLDTRLFRSDQPCGDGVKAECHEALDPNRTMLGDTQERWLYDGFKHARARWTVLGQQVMVMRNDRDPDPKVFAPSMDKWDGAVAARDCLFTAIEAAKVANVVALTGDVHQNWAGELKKDFADEKSATLGVEFVATSVASGGDGFDINDNFKALLQQDPHIKFFNSQRGYVRHVVTPNRWQADFQVLDKVSVPDGRVSTHKSFVVESGKSGLAEALVVLDCAPLNVRRVFQGIIDLAAMHRLPAMYHSFQPGREASADALAAEMARSAIRQAKLPFIESPDHDTLLDQVKQEIRDCDVFVCVPGSRPSFVESEVSMAFGLEKPLLFVLIEADTPRLPNTAKKGYPVFALERFQREGFGTLVNFCSYPAADWRSTVRLYGAVLAHIRACAKLAGAICLVSIVALTRVMGASAMPDHTDPGGSFLGWTQAFVSNRAILWIIATSLVLFLVPYGLFSMTRLVLRAKLRRVIAGKKFSDSFLPETLAYSLTRADLLKDGPKSYAELATAAGAHPGALYRLLRMLASVGMFAEVGHGHFTLIPLTTLLFDRPHVLEGAQRGVEAAGVGDRCEIVPRDFFTAVPAGGDVYILKWVLLDWEDEHALTILRNCHRVMQDQGKLLVVEMLIPPGNAPFAGKVIDLGILVSVPGRHRTEAEYRGLLSAAGFTLSRVIPTKSPRQVSILESLRA